jgi:membrane-associated protein
MELISFIIHAEHHLRHFISVYGVWVYALLFFIVFCETGFIVTPFLPGDSLLFSIGVLAAEGLIDLKLIFILLLVAAILGDSVNYWIGYKVGPRVFKWEKSRWFNPQHLNRAHVFYERHGGNAIVLSRFVPIIRTFAPFVAGIAVMKYRLFLFYNVVGALAWIAIFLLGGYFLGQMPFIKGNLKIVILIIIVVSILPIIVEWWKANWKSRIKPTA